MAEGVERASGTAGAGDGGSAASGGLDGFGAESPGSGGLRGRAAGGPGPVSPAVGEAGGRRSVHHRIGDAAELGIEGLSHVSVVGSGGSSTVYRARQDALDRTVAVKVVHAAWSIETRERFQQERQVMGRLSGHAAIVPIFETGITNRGEPYLLMPFYERGSLFRLMQDRGPLPWREATFMVETLAQALADCHRAGIVHRDVKPGNVMLTEYLRPRLGDFGITLPDGTGTAGAAVAYTPSYSPPEAFTAGVTGPTIDVYGLGATLWALLAGRAPFTAAGETVDGAEVIERSISQDIDQPTDGTPGPVTELLRRAMSKDPTRRPTDAVAFGAELRRAVRLSEQRVDSPAKLGSAVGVARRDRLVTGLFITMVTAGLLLLMAGIGWLLAT